MKTDLRKSAAVLLAVVIATAPQTRAQVFITMPAEGEVSPFRNQAVIGVAPANLPVWLEVNGVPADSATVMPNGAFEFLGVPSPEGPVTYVVTVRLPNGRTFNAQRSMHVLGPPDTIKVAADTDRIPADGRTVLRVSASVLDAWNVPIQSGYFVTVNPESLSAVGEDADPSTPGHQLRLSNGIVEFGLTSDRYVGPSTVTLITNGIETRLPFFAQTPHVPFVMVASADATGKHLTSRGSLTGLSSPADFKTGMHGQGRLAAMARGTVFEDYLMTLSIDTDRDLQDRIFRDLDPNSLYSMYGDNSIVTYEAQSTSPVYLKVERDRSYVMYGDYNTEVSNNEYAAYNRSLSGGKLHLEDRRYSLDVFGTATNRKVVQDELRGQGISGYYYLTEHAIVTGSEKVRIEVRDRFHSELVISRKDKARYSDYEIDYVQGSLYFKQPVPSLDDQNNPVYIVVSYEAITRNANNLVAGGSGEVRPFENLTLGTSLVVEDRMPKNYTLFGGNVRWSLDQMGSLQGAYARSGELNASGNAWKVEAHIAPYQLFSLRPYYRKVDDSFVNPTQSGSGREVGTTKYGTTLDVEPVGGTRVSGEFYEQRQTLGLFSTELQSISGSIAQKLGDFADVSAKIEDMKYDGENPEMPSQNLNTHSTILGGGLHARIVEGLRATAGVDKNLRGTGKQVRPDAVTLGLEYQISPAVAMYAQQKIQAEHGNLTTVGINTKVTDETSVYGKYEIGGSAGGERNAATIGLKNIWHLTEEITANILFEKTKNLSKNLAEARTPDHDAISLGLEYFPSFPLRATAKGEYTVDNANVRTGLNYGLSCRILDGLSALAKGTHFVSKARIQAGQTRQADHVFGVAYRPAFTNWLNLIGKVEFKSDANSVVEPVTGHRASIISSHIYIEPTHRLEFGIKYAFKHAYDEYDGGAVSTTSDFILVRPQYDLTSKWNLAAEVRILRQHAARDMKTGYSLEAGYVFVKNMMISVGYNIQAYRDRDLFEDIYSVSGPYVTLRMKFTEEILGLGHNGRESRDK